MKGKDLIKLLKDLDIDISEDEPIFPLNIACELLNLHYWTLHELFKEGIIKPHGKGKKKKLLSYYDMKLLKYVKYLIEEKGVNIKGVKAILEIERKI